MLKNGYRADPKRTDDGASEVTCSWPLPPWAAEVGPAQHHFSRSGGSSLSTCAPQPVVCTENLIRVDDVVKSLKLAK